MKKNPQPKKIHKNSKFAKKLRTPEWEHWTHIQKMVSSSCNFFFRMSLSNGLTTIWTIREWYCWEIIYLSMDEKLNYFELDYLRNSSIRGRNLKKYISWLKIFRTVVLSIRIGGVVEFQPLKRQTWTFMKMITFWYIFHWMNTEWTELINGSTQRFMRNFKRLQKVGRSISLRSRNQIDKTARRT